jgi:hypothetical protein
MKRQREKWPRRPWSEAEFRLLRSLYPDRPTQEIADFLKRGVSAVYRMAGKLDLHKSESFQNSALSGRLIKGGDTSRGAATRYVKGQAPANKGVKHPPGWGPGRMKQTQFKKGERTGIAAKNWKPIGTILKDPDGYLRIKIREAVSGKEPTGFGNTKVWPLLNRVVWEQHKGPIPPKHMVIFKDRNRDNCAIDNLDCISMRDNAARNRMWTKYPRELAEVMQLTGALRRKIKGLSERTNDNAEEQNRRPA